MAYIGVSPSNGVRRVHTYTATASQTTFTGAGAEGTTLSYKDSNYVDVYQNGVKLGDADYTATSGTSIVLGTGATASDLVVIVVFDVFSVADTVSKADGGTFDGIISTSSAGTNNLRIGANAGDAIASGGNYNVVLGDEAGTAITTGDNNVAVGYNALATNTTASTNTAVGYQAAYSNQTGVGITAFGANALYATTASDNCGIGTDNPGNYAAALESNTTGRFNTAVATGALGANTEGNYNTAVGHSAGAAVTTGTRNTFTGNESGKTITTTFGNTFYGYRSGLNSTAQLGTFIGDNAGQNATGNNNTLIGQQAGYLITSGGSNTIIGRYDGNQDSLDIRTSSNNIVISDGDGNAELFHRSGGDWVVRSEIANDIGVIIQNQSSTNPYVVSLQTPNSADNDGGSAFLICADNSANRLVISDNGNVTNQNNSYGAISDEKLKEQITDASSQWNDIKALTIRKYKMKEEVSAKGDSDDLWRLGVVAQELETAGMNGLIKEDKDVEIDEHGNLNDLGTTTKTVKYSILYMKAVKALQEAMARIETLEAKVTALENAE